MVWATFEVDCARNHTFYNDFVEKISAGTPKWNPPRCWKSDVGGLGSTGTGKTSSERKMDCSWLNPPPANMTKVMYKDTSYVSCRLRLCKHKLQARKVLTRRLGSADIRINKDPLKDI